MHDRAIRLRSQCLLHVLFLMSKSWQFHHLLVDVRSSYHCIATILDTEYTLQKIEDNYPIGSMYGIYANIGGILMVNVTIYSIHGSYGYGKATMCLSCSPSFSHHWRNCWSSTIKTTACCTSSPGTSSAVSFPAVPPEPCVDGSLNGRVTMMGSNGDITDITFRVGDINNHYIYNY